MDQSGNIQQIKYNRITNNGINFLNSKVSRSAGSLDEIPCYFVGMQYFLRIDHNIEEIRIRLNVDGLPDIDDELFADLIKKYFKVENYFTIIYGKED